MTTIKKEFDPHAPDFTLGSVILLGLDQFTEQIGEVSLTARKEVSIEESLVAINATWTDLKLEIANYKDRGHHVLKGTDEIYQILEDNQVYCRAYPLFPFFVNFFFCFAPSS